MMTILLQLYFNTRCFFFLAFGRSISGRLGCSSISQRQWDYLILKDKNEIVMSILEQFSAFKEYWKSLIINDVYQNSKFSSKKCFEYSKMFRVYPQIRIFDFTTSILYVTYDFRYKYSVAFMYQHIRNIDLISFIL